MLMSFEISWVDVKLEEYCLKFKLVIVMNEVD